MTYSLVGAILPDASSHQASLLLTSLPLVAYRSDGGPLPTRCVMASTLSTHDPPELWVHKKAEVAGQ